MRERDGGMCACAFFNPEPSALSVAARALPHCRVCAASGRRGFQVLYGMCASCVPAAPSAVRAERAACRLQATVKPGIED
eukprot:scaffold4580_cov128-Isochrysis_galbana.AAC.1